MSTTTSVSRSHPLIRRDDIVTSKVIELDPLETCSNCDGAGDLFDEYRSPPSGECPCCRGDGRTEEDAESFVARMSERAPFENASIRSQRLTGVLTQVLQHLEEVDSELRQDVREIIASNMAPGSLTAWDSNRNHDVDVHPATGGYRRL